MPFSLEGFAVFTEWATSCGPVTLHTD